ncbi:MAG: tripartite tricarboxylate transporter TctB family protein, partial [Beijerinckiaceae bacterium]
MGPGFFPTWLSWMIGAMGLANVVRSTVLTGPAIEAFQWRPIFFVCLGALIFGWFIEHIGLALALVVMTMVAVQARRDTRQGQLLILSVVMAVLSVVVFVYILKQGMPAWWGR